MIKRIIVFLLVVCYAVTGCVLPSDVVRNRNKETKPMRYLALGDSYTIGESVAEAERWPVQLAAQLRAAGIMLDQPLIIARTGWRTDELIDAIESQKPQGPFDLVSLLIGVNNQYQGHSSDEYRTQFRALLQTAIGLAGGKASHVIVLSIPDWGVTPFAEGRKQQEIATEIDLFNAINREETTQAGAHYIDITPISRQAVNDGALIAHDGLHPSGKMYKLWVELVMPEANAAIAGTTQP
jgi:lysophospholipase L1-like esterase